MIELPEYAAKQRLADSGIRIPDGEVVTDPDQQIDSDPPSVIKAQIPLSSRGTQGGILFAETAEEVRSAVRELLGSKIGGYRVESVLVEEQIQLERELYVAISAEGSGSVPTLIVSPFGGEEIEDLDDSQIAEVGINPLVGLQSYHLRNAEAELSKVDGGGGSIPRSAIERVARPMWELFQSLDLRVLELNPIGMTGDDVVSLDAKFIVDESAGFRQEYETTQSSLTPIETEAADDGIELRVSSGAIGIISNGAGMGLSTIDLVEQYSEAGLAGFIDTHGAQFDWEDIHDFLAYLERAGASVVIVNVIGPFLDCSKIAAELAEAVDGGYQPTIVARFKGLESEEGIEICNQAGIETSDDVVEAVEKAADLAEEAEY